MITNKSDSHKWLQIQYNINEVIKPVFQNDFTSTKKHKTAYSEQK